MAAKTSVKMDQVKHMRTLSIGYYPYGRKDVSQPGSGKTYVDIVHKAAMVSANMDHVKHMDIVLLSLSILPQWSQST